MILRRFCMTKHFSHAVSWCIQKTFIYDLFLIRELIAWSYVNFFFCIVLVIMNIHAYVSGETNVMKFFKREYLMYIELMGLLLY